MSKNPAAVALGRLGGSVKSKPKADAARENGKKGGAPKGKRKPKPKRVSADALVQDLYRRLMRQSREHRS